ncbi:ABC transporter permease [Pseudonocardia sp. NPDC049635]|uniref:ABC transporter permease n=1 Tax=Pseudonocardia sp. NPDC049635 TaxID=3155506 RepID=UPI0033CC23B0
MTTSLTLTAPARVTSLRSVIGSITRYGAVATVSWGVLALIVLAALVAPLLPFYDPYTQNLGGAYLPMFARADDGTLHLLGTDSLGVDTLSQLLLGARLSLVIAVGSVLVSAVIGVTLGVAAGYLGGLIDRFVVVMIDVSLAVPRVLFMIPVVAVLGSSLWLLILLIGVTGWVVFARVVRTQVLSLRRRDYVDAAIMMGSGHLAVVRRHILPNLRSSVVVLASLDLGSVVVMEAGLSYLGLGVQPPQTSWGLMIEQAQDYIVTDPRLLIVPSIALVVLVLAINLGTRPFTAEFRPGRRRGAESTVLPGA